MCAPVGRKPRTILISGRISIAKRKSELKYSKMRKRPEFNIDKGTLPKTQ